MPVDFFPTLVDMAGLPPCNEDLSGVSLGPVLRDPPSKGAGSGQKYLPPTNKCPDLYKFSGYIDWYLPYISIVQQN